tara:strand:- start:33033 stop:35834 length:2802 start_codon:yes stop_codon:yes gene_type:complete
MPFGGMFMGNNKQNSIFGILQCYYESHVFNSNPLVDNPNWQYGGGFRTFNFDNPVSPRYHTDCSLVVFNNKRTISYWRPSALPTHLYNEYNALHNYWNYNKGIINWDGHRWGGGWTCGIKWKGQIGSITVRAEGTITWCRISDDGINWESYGDLNDIAADRNTGWFELPASIQGGQIFEVRPTTRYFIIGQQRHGGQIHWIQINEPILPKTEWIVPAENNLVRRMFALRPGYPVSDKIDLNNTGIFTNTNNNTFKEPIHNEGTHPSPQGNFPYYHNNSSNNPIDLIIEFTKPVWCNGFQYLHDRDEGDKTAINAIDVFSSDTLHPSETYVVGTYFNDASWNIERYNRPDNIFAFPVAQSGASNSLNPTSLKRNPGTVVPFYNSNLEWLPSRPVTYVKIRVLSNLATYNNNIFDNRYITIKLISLKIADPDNIIQVNNNQIRHISLNYTQFIQDSISTIDSIYQANINNGNHVSNVTFDFNDNNGLLNSTDIIGAVPSAGWNNILPFERFLSTSTARNWSIDGHNPGVAWQNGGQYSSGIVAIIQPSSYSEFNNHSNYYTLKLRNGEWIRNNYIFDTYKIGNRTWTFYYFNNDSFREPVNYFASDPHWWIEFKYEDPHTNGNINDWRSNIVLIIMIDRYRLGYYYLKQDGSLSQWYYPNNNLITHGPVYFRVIFDYTIANQQTVSIGYTTNTSPGGPGDWTIVNHTDMYIAPNQKWHYEFRSTRQNLYMDIMNSDGILPWNNLTGNISTATLTYPETYSLKDNNGFLLGDILSHNNITTNQSLYYNFGTNILFNSCTWLYGGDTTIAIPIEFQTTGYVVRIYGGPYLHTYTTDYNSWRFRVRDGTNYDRYYSINPVTNSDTDPTRPHFPIVTNTNNTDPYGNVLGYYGSKHSSSPGTDNSNYAYFDGDGNGLTGAILTISGWGISGIQITQRSS